MTLNELKSHLHNVEKLHFLTDQGQDVPRHFHLTEIAKVQKDFIDCGGTTRQELKASLQLWVADDFYHRLSPEKFLRIIEMSEDKLNLGDVPVEVEYQGETIGTYILVFSDGKFVLTSKQTDCLARELCTPAAVVKGVAEKMQNACCTPGSGCC